MTKQIVIFLLMLLPAGPALACTCKDAFDSTSSMRQTEKQLMIERLKNAEIVIRGEVLVVRAGKEVAWPEGAKLGQSVASASNFADKAVFSEIKVIENRKGKTASVVQVYSGFGIGDCGLAGGFLVAVAANLPISMELVPIPSKPNAYMADQCGFFEIQH